MVRKEQLFKESFLYSKHYHNTIKPWRLNYMKEFIITFLSVLFIATNLSAQSTSLYIPGGGNFMIYNRGAQNFIIMNNKFTRSAYNSAMKKLSSGKRINSAADDPSGLAVSEKLDALMKQLSQESMNMQISRLYRKTS